MKRFLAFALVLAFIGAAAFAEVEFSGSGSATLVPLGVRAGDETETVAGTEVRWGNNGPAITLTGKAQNEAGIIGAVVDINADGGGITLGDNGKVWLKPFDWFKVTVGKFQEDDLRYKIGVSGGGFHNYLLYIRGSNMDENAFFSRFKANGFGAHLALTPVEGLYIGAALGSTFAKRSVAELREDGAQDVFANAQVGLGYTIKDIGFARFQFNGAKPVEEDGSATPGFQAVGADATQTGAPTIQAAFQLTAVKGLNIDIGGQIPVSTYEKDTYSTPTPGTKTGTSVQQYPYIVGVGFDFTAVAPFRFYGRVSYKTGGYTEETKSGVTTKKKDGDNLLFSFTPMYTITDGWILGLEFMLDMQSGSDLSALSDDGKTARGGDVDNQYKDYWADPSRVEKAKTLKNNYLDLGFGPYLRHNFKGGDVRFGVTAKVPGGEAHEGASVQVFVPIILNYSF
jgi:hypothetical protein